MRKGLAPFVLLVGVVATGCRAEPQAEASVAADPTTASVHQPASGSTCDQSTGSTCGHNQQAQHHEGSECAKAAGPIANPEVVTRQDPATGQTVYVVGSPLAEAPAVKVADLVAKPADFQGKTVRLEGNVSAMCTHRRGWFAVQDEGDRAGTYVRVLTAPQFLVPAGSIGKKARTEGVVEVIRVNHNDAKHFEQGHQLPHKADETGAIKAVVVRATGAEFR